MKILRVNYHSPFYDVFTGMGWKNWTRVFVDKRKSNIRVIKGDSLDSEQKQVLNSHFFKG